MNNFNTGDKVRRVSPVCPTTKRATGIQKDGIYTVGESYGGGGITLEESYRRTFTFTAANFELVEAMGDDDELPPAPESVMYFNSIRDKGNDQCITVRPDNNPYYAGTLYISVHPRGDYTGYQSVALDPDAALQLAHDLRRMAMEIRRKERAGS